MSQIIKVPGKNPGTWAYLYDGYSYNVDKRGTKNTFHCSSKTAKSCKGTLKRTKHGIITTQHNHKPVPHLYEKQKMIKKMIVRAQTTTGSLKDIFDNVCRGNPAIGKYLSYRSMRNRLEKARAKQRPKVPHSLSELHTSLKDYEPLKGFYHGIIKANASCGLVFSSPVLLKALSLAFELYMDGTFAVTPRVTKIMQLYSIHIRVMDVGIPAVFLLTEKRTAGLYKAMWNKLFQLVPTLKEKVSFIMTDYERAAISAAKSHFPNAHHHGCWFHYCQALRRMWKKLGLSACDREVLRMAMNLALAPANRFEDGLAVIFCRAKEEAKDFPKIIAFVEYIKATWAPLAEIVSVYGCPVRTNNLVESFHSTAKAKLGGVHPNVWVFLEKLKELIQDQEINLARIEEGEDIHRPRPTSCRIRDSVIKEKQDDLVSDRTSLRSFLRLFREEHEANFALENWP